MSTLSKRLTALWPSIWRRARDVAGGAGVCSFAQDIQFIRDTYHSALGYMPNLDAYTAPIKAIIYAVVSLYRATLYPLFDFIPFHPPFIFCDIVVSLLTSLTIIDLWTRRKYRRVTADVAAQVRAIEQGFPPEFRQFQLQSDGKKFQNAMSKVTALKALRDARSVSKGTKTMENSPALQTMMVQMATAATVSKNTSAIAKMYLEMSTDIIAMAFMFFILLTILEADVIYRVIVRATLIVNSREM